MAGKPELCRVSWAALYRVDVRETGEIDQQRAEKAGADGQLSRFDREVVELACARVLLDMVRSLWIGMGVAEGTHEEQAGRPTLAPAHRG